MPWQSLTLQRGKYAQPWRSQEVYTSDLLMARECVLLLLSRVSIKPLLCESQDVLQVRLCNYSRYNQQGKVRLPVILYYPTRQTIFQALYPLSGVSKHQG